MKQKTTPHLAYPLDWPTGYARAPRQKRAAFKLGDLAGRAFLRDEVRLYGGTYAIFSSNVPSRRDGMPSIREPEPSDPGVAVYFLRQRRQLVIPCDRWSTVTDNLIAVGHAIKALRGLDRWGTGEVAERAAQAFTALPPSEHDWRIIFDGARTWEECRSAYKAKAMDAHPDRGGSDAAMAKLNAALAIAQAELGR